MYDNDLEHRALNEIKNWQEIALRELLLYVSKYSPFYKELFTVNKTDIEKIRKLEDLSQIPFTTKDDLNSRNNDFICVGKEKIIDYITTSGTLGEPVTFAMTNSDLERLAYNEYLSFTCAGITKYDIFQLMTTIDRRFMAGLAYFLGARRLGAGIIRVGNGIPEMQWDTVKRFSPTCLIVVPSFILKIIEYAETHDIDYRTSGVRKAVCIGENLRNQDFKLNTLGERIKEKWDIQLFSTYASTEMGASFTECEYGCGGHHHPELLICEFIDENDRPVPEDEPGELVVTTLSVEGMPLIRFKTGDICRRYTEPCKCGRTTLRLGPIVGRKKQMIKFKGTTLYPPAFYDVLDNVEGVQGYIVEAYTNEFWGDSLLVHVGTTAPGQSLERLLKDRFRVKLRVAPDIVFKSPSEILKQQFPETSRKPIKFIDRRTNH